jgi:hypothetical protein
MKYRVKTYTYLADNGETHTHYYPQIKRWYGWRNISTYPYGPSVVFYGLTAEKKAVEFIEKYKENYPKVSYTYD